MRTGLYLIGCFLATQAVFAGTIVDLGGLAGGNTEPTAINNSGQVTGSTLDANFVSHAFLYSAGQLTDLGLGTGDSSYGLAINDSGVVTGRLADQNTEWAAVFSGGNVTELKSALGSPSVANAVNNNGVVAGDVYSNNMWDSFSYQTGTGFTLTTYRPHTDANGINSNGDIAGTGASTFFHHAFLYSGNSATDLGALNGFYSQAEAINDNGEVVGASQFDTTTNYEAFLWTSQGGMVGLGTLDGTDSWANALNASGQIVGNSGSSAFLYANSSLIDLNSLLPANSGWQLLTATGINNQGQIVGTGLDNGTFTGYLLDLNGVATPEPQTWNLTAAGLALLLIAVRFRKTPQPAACSD